MKKLYTLGIVMLFALTTVFANEVVVNQGDDIIAKVAEVEDGGTLTIMPGVYKASYSNIEINVSMTIKNNGGVNDTRVHIKQIDIPANDISLTIDGIIWSGAAVDSLTGIETVSEEDLEGDYFLNFISGDANAFGNITVKNSIMNHFNRSIIRGDRDSYFAKSISFDNCIIGDLRGGGDYGPFRMKSKITFDKFEIKNCTFYSIPNKLIDLQDMDDYPCDIKIDQCTFYNWGGGKSGQYLFDIKNNAEASLTVTNCIFGKTMVADEVTVNGWRIDDGEGNAIKYNELSYTVMTPNFVLENGAYADIEFSKAEYNYPDTDAGFTDPDNNNFQIPAGSDLFQMSGEGTLVGDPRWANAPVSVKQLEESGIKVYPTIASEMIYVETKGDAPSKVTIYSATGKHVMTVDNVAGNQSINISSLERGAYMITVENEHVQNFRFLKK